MLGKRRVLMISLRFMTEGNNYCRIFFFYLLDINSATTINISNSCLSNSQPSMSFHKFSRFHFSQ